jgi:hypothetical protein
MINAKCYTFELIKYTEGFLDTFVDATYIITMEGSERRKHIDLQLKTYIPTKNIYIVNNKGFKKCEKKLIEYTSSFDLTDAYFNTINHSLNNNYNNILILEDDFIFSPKIKDKNIIKDLKLFFDKNKEKTFYYNLGPFPILFYPNLNILNNTYKGFLTINSQSIIYTKKVQIDIIKNIQKCNIAWDIYLSYTYEHYFFKYSLCSQTFPETDNQKHWYKLKIMLDIHIFIIKKLGLDKKPDPGYKIIYNILFAFNYGLMIIILALIYYIIYYIIKSLNSKKLSKIKIKKMI